MNAYVALSRGGLLPVSYYEDTCLLLVWGHMLTPSMRTHAHYTFMLLTKWYWIGAAYCQIFDATYADVCWRMLTYAVVLDRGGLLPDLRRHLSRRNTRMCERARDMRERVCWRMLTNEQESEVPVCLSLSLSFFLSRERNRERYIYTERERERKIESESIVSLSRLLSHCIDMYIYIYLSLYIYTYIQSVCVRERERETEGGGANCVWVTRHWHSRWRGPGTSIEKERHIYIFLKRLSDLDWRNLSDLEV